MKLKGEGGYLEEGMSDGEKVGEGERVMIV
jgi:hypothetical protein